MSSRRFLSLSIVLAGAWLLAGSASIQAGPPTAKIDYKLPKSTTLGEPAIMTTRLYNTTGYRITADFGVDDQTKFVFRQTKPDGTVVKVEPFLPETRGQRTSRLMLRGNTHTAFVVLDEWMSFADTGRYQIEVEFLGRVSLEGGNEAGLKRTARFAIDVKPRDGARLEKRAAGWLKQVSTLSPSHESRAATAALVAMKDPVAIPFLELAAARTRSGTFVNALEAMGSADARGALERLARNADPDVRALAQKALGR